jgi:uncharacterized protein YndB with AHSA1/START domain
LSNLKLTSKPVAKAEMLIRRPIGQVFNAFVDPEITTKFWFTSGSSRLEAGKQVMWSWDMYNVSVQVDVLLIEKNKRIIIDWGVSGGKQTRVEWVFTPYNDSTFVSVTNSGFVGDGDTLVNAALDSTGGFTLVLAGAKAWLEHNVMLNLVADHNPQGHA